MRFKLKKFGVGISSSLVIASSLFAASHSNICYAGKYIDEIDSFISEFKEIYEGVGNEEDMYVPFIRSNRPEGEFAAEDPDMVSRFKIKICGKFMKKVLSFSIKQIQDAGENIGEVIDKLGRLDVVMGVTYKVFKSEFGEKGNFCTLLKDLQLKLKSKIDNLCKFKIMINDPAKQVEIVSALKITELIPEFNKNSVDGPLKRAVELISGLDANYVVFSSGVAQYRTCLDDLKKAVEGAKIRLGGNISEVTKKSLDDLADQISEKIREIKNLMKNEEENRNSSLSYKEIGELVEKLDPSVFVDLSPLQQQNLNVEVIGKLRKLDYNKIVSEGEVEGFIDALRGLKDAVETVLKERGKDLSEITVGFMKNSVISLIEKSIQKINEVNEADIGQNEQQSESSNNADVSGSKISVGVMDSMNNVGGFNNMNMGMNLGINNVSYSNMGNMGMNMYDSSGKFPPYFNLSGMGNFGCMNNMNNFGGYNNMNMGMNLGINNLSCPNLNGMGNFGCMNSMNNVVGMNNMNMGMNLGINNVGNSMYGNMNNMGMSNSMNMHPQMGGFGYYGNNAGF